MAARSGTAVTAPMLSVVMPAFNEQALLAETLTRLESALAGSGLDPRDYEIIVCDNASTDATAGIARDHGALVVREPHRQIARARNTGADQARGRYLLFVDADTWPSAALIRKSVELLTSGWVCGGGSVVSSQGLSPGLRPLLGSWNLCSRLGRVACGAYLFCERDAFQELGGFSNTLYAAEEIDLSRRLRAWGKRRDKGFTIIAAHPLQTSMRKMHLYTSRELAGMLFRGLAHPLRALRDRRYLDAWYDGRR